MSLDKNEICYSLARIAATPAASLKHKSSYCAQTESEYIPPGPTANHKLQSAVPNGIWEFNKEHSILCRCREARQALHSGILRQWNRKWMQDPISCRFEKNDLWIIQSHLLKSGHQSSWKSLNETTAQTWRALGRSDPFFIFYQIFLLDVAQWSSVLRDCVNEVHSIATFSASEQRQQNFFHLRVLFGVKHSIKIFFKRFWVGNK